VETLNKLTGGGVSCRVTVGWIQDARVGSERRKTKVHGRKSTEGFCIQSWPLWSGSP